MIFFIISPSSLKSNTAYSLNAGLSRVLPGIFFKMGKNKKRGGLARLIAGNDRHLKKSFAKKS